MTYDDHKPSGFLHIIRGLPVFLPSALFIVATIVALILMLKHRTWCALASVIAGPFLALGSLFPKALGKGWGPPGGLQVRLDNIFVCIGAYLIMRQVLITFSRMSSFLQPGPDGSTLLKERKTASYLLHFNLVAICAVFIPILRIFALFPEITFCVYFAYLNYAHAESYTRAAERKHAATLSEAEPSRPMMDLFFANRRIAVILILRAACGGILSLCPEFHLRLLLDFITSQGALLLCYWTFFRSYPGWYLPQDWTYLRYRPEPKGYQPVPLTEIS